MTETSESQGPPITAHANGNTLRGSHEGIRTTGSISSQSTTVPKSLLKSNGASPFATVAAPQPSTAGANRASVLGPAFDAAPLPKATSTTAAADQRLSLLSQDDTWDISLMEKKPSGKRNKTREPMYTVYVTTPTASMTLSRSRAQIVALDQGLRSQAKDLLPPDSPVHLLGVDDTSAASAPPRKQRRGPIFATLSRTLSPNRRRKAAAAAGSEPADAPSIDAVFVEHPGPVKEDHLPTARVSYYLSELAKHTSLHQTQPWTHFFQPGPNDLQSQRLERRVRQMRSDPALKTTSSAASNDLAAARKDSDADSLAAIVALHQQFIDSASVPDMDDVHPLSTGAPAPPNGQLPTPAPTPARAQDVFLDEDGALSAAEAAQGIMENASACEPTEHEVEPKQNDVPSPSLLAASEQTTALNGAHGVVSATPKKSRKRVERQTAVTDFDILRVLGKGCAGKVMLVRHHTSTKLYAMKSIHKHHVLAHRELLHTLTEQSVLRRVAQDCDNPFVVRMWWSFHNKENLFLVLDFHPGGDLATQLARWGRLGRDRTRFYCAEIAEGLEGLHHAGVIYRDLKPENVLIAVDGHIVLTDFGLSKQFDRPARRHRSSGDPPFSHQSDITAAPEWMQEHSMSSPPSPRHWQDQRETTTTFCGTAEYLAPEVLLGDAYSYECDAWSYGTMLYEMLTGMTPFWADDHTTMYRRVLHEELSFDEDDRNLDNDTKGLLRGLLQKNPTFRMTDARIKRHPYFSMIDWEYVRTKRYIAPFIPSINPEDELDTSNFDEAFLSMPAEVADAAEETAADQEDNVEEKREPQSELDENGRDVFEGYSFGTDNASESVEDEQEELEEEEDEDTRLPSTALSEDQVKRHPADLSQALLQSDHLQAPPADKEADNISCSDRSSSSHQSHTDRDLSMQVSGHSTDPSTATSEAHTKEASDPVKQDVQSPPVCSPSQEPVAEIPEAEEDDWDVVEQEVEVAQNGRNIDGRRGIGKTLFQKGVPDRYVLAVKDVVRPTPKRTASSRQKLPVMARSGSSRSSSIEGSSGAESPSQSRRKVFKLPRNSSTGQIAPPLSGQRTPMKMRFRMARPGYKNRYPKDTPPSQVSLDRTDSPSSSSDRTAGPTPVIQRSYSETSVQLPKPDKDTNPLYNIVKRNGS